MDKNGHRVLRTGFRIDAGASIPVIFTNFVDPDFDDENLKPLSGECLDHLAIPQLSNQLPSPRLFDIVFES